MTIGQMRFRHIKKEKMVKDAKREKEPFEYLFLDIEWNQAPGTSGLDGREAIQIGVVAADAQIQKVKTFSKAIRLSDPKIFNEETEIISHSTIAHVMRGNEVKAVLEKFALSFPQYCHLIVWNRDTYDLFLRDMRKNGVTIKRHKAVVFRMFWELLLEIVTIRLDLKKH